MPTLREIRTKPRRSYHKAQDAAVLPRIQALVAKHPTYGYRRIAALLNRELRSLNLPAVNHKRVYRILKNNDLLLERSGFDRPERTHDGKVIMLRSNPRWCSDGLEFTCWNGDVIRLAFVKTLKRDYVRANPLLDAETVLSLIGGWIEDYNENHPHSG